MGKMRNAVILAWAMGVCPPAAPAQEAGEPVDFYGEIQPILAIHCVKCHGAEKPKSGYRVDLRGTFLKGGDSGEAAVVPGKSSSSALLRRVSSADPEEKMPPKGERLAPEQVALLRRWIDQGAPWPEKDSYWAFRPPVRPAVPQVKGAAAVRNPIDAFLLSKLEAKGLTLSPPAGKTAILRRLHADLVGMPPSPEEAAAFLADEAPDPVARLVDRLLADPRYGERWARHWLDLVRYAESDGFENDKVRPHAWRYRDYVIRALNEDKPYDRFVREQVAGDELWPGEPDALVATAFARLSAWDELCKNEKQRWQDYLNDATDTTGSVFLGLTVGCARCHDHKYDRITMEDYYSLQAFFAGAKRDRKPLPGAPDPEGIRGRLAEAERAIAPMRLERRRLLGEARRTLYYWTENALGPDVRVVVTDDDVKKLVERRRPKRLGELDAKIKEAEEAADVYRPLAEGVFASGGAPARTHVLLRGTLGMIGPEVKPAFIAALAADRAARGGRKALADWLASPENPMTARVIVNRLWQHHFGRGIVATPSDFGRNGMQPTHRELLDWLACELAERGWSLKSMHRLMLSSSAYRQSASFVAEGARVDPENRLLWRMNRARLEGEALRDSLLWVSGRLNPERGGPGVYARVSKEVLVDLPNNDKRPAWGTCTEEEGRRRTIYVFQRRALMLPIVEAFDGAEMNHTCPKRAVTTVAPQALALFNGEFARGESGHFADRVAREAGDDRGSRVERAWRLALARPPTAGERERAVAFLEEQAARRFEPAGAGTGAGRPDAAARKQAERMALVDLCHVLVNSNEFVYVD